MPTPPEWFAPWLAARVNHFTRWDHFTTWLNYWQTLLAGILAFFAGFFALAAAWLSVQSAERQARWSVESVERQAREKEQRENDGMLLSLAAEVRQYIENLLKTIRILRRLSARTNTCWRAI
jgi:hypothetical protein